MRKSHLKTRRSPSLGSGSTISNLRFKIEKIRIPHSAIHNWDERGLSLPGRFRERKGAYRPGLDVGRGWKTEFELGAARGYWGGRYVLGFLPEGGQKKGAEGSKKESSPFLGLHCQVVLEPTFPFFPRPFFPHSSFFPIFHAHGALTPTKNFSMLPLNKTWFK